MKIYDITRTITTESCVWPGDTPFSFEHGLRLDAGDSVNLTTITLSPHTGTHADAYYHYEPDGSHPAQMPLDAYIGPARVVRVARPDGPLTPADFDHVDLTGAQRLLVRSHVSDLDDRTWPELFPYLSVELVEWLAGLGVVLAGLDSPSVDALDSTTLPCHHALHRHGMVNLESLCLRDVPDGAYELIALPLRLGQVCGSPVRAVLRTMPVQPESWRRSS
ncbi:MAG: cyclase family protein [Phototrophicaceae bacterium]